MQRITILNDNAKQKFKVQLETGEMVDFKFWFSHITTSWFFSFTFQDKTADNLMLSNCPNLIREYKSVLPFGIACTVADNYEPYKKDDFVSGRVNVYILDKAEIERVENDIYG